MTEVIAAYFDGRSSQPRAVRLRFAPDGWLHIEADGLQLAFPRDHVRIAARLGRTARFIHLPGEAHCETVDNDGVDAGLKAWGKGGGGRWLHRIETSWRLVVVSCVVLLAAGFLTVRYGLPAAAEKAAHALPASVTDRLGTDTLATLDRIVFEPSKLPAERQAEIRAKFSEMLEAAGDPMAYRLEFRDSGRMGPNAFALPSGELVMTDALVTLAEDDREILAVLAHEVGHVRHRHILRAVLQNSAVVVVFTLITGDVSSATAFGAALPTYLLQSKFSREFENEADAFAVDYLRKAGLEPRHLADILDRLTKAHRHDDDSDMLDYLSSHPPTAERRSRILGER
jgi:Zn-dependent protease with chaperone function